MLEPRETTSHVENTFRARLFECRTAGLRSVCNQVLRPTNSNSFSRFSSVLQQMLSSKQNSRCFSRFLRCLVSSHYPPILIWKFIHTTLQLDSASSLRCKIKKKKGISPFAFFPTNIPSSEGQAGTGWGTFKPPDTNFLSVSQQYILVRFSNLFPPSSRFLYVFLSFRVDWYFLASLLQLDC